MQITTTKQSASQMQTTTTQQSDGNKSNSQMETNATVRCKQIQQSDTHNYIVQQEKTTNNLPQAHTDRQPHLPHRHLTSVDFVNTIEPKNSFRNKFWNLHINVSRGTLS